MKKRMKQEQEKERERERERGKKEEERLHKCGLAFGPLNIEAGLDRPRPMCWPPEWFWIRLLSAILSGCKRDSAALTNGLERKRGREQGREKQHNQLTPRSPSAKEMLVIC